MILPQVCFFLKHTPLFFWNIYTVPHKPELSGTAPAHEPCEPVPPEERLLVKKKTWFLVTQEGMSSCATRGHILLHHKKTCLLKSIGNMHIHVFQNHTYACFSKNQDSLSWPPNSNLANLAIYVMFIEK